MCEELRSPGCHYTTPISSHRVGEVDEECYHVCIINVAHSSAVSFCTSKGCYTSKAKVERISQKKLITY